MKYTLAKLTDYVENLRVGEIGETSVRPYLKNSVHIEHILPDNPSDGLIKIFSNGDNKEYDLYKGKIGNLTLLERPINTSVQNDFFEKKAIEYTKSKYCLTKTIAKIEDVGLNTSINKANSLLEAYTTWDKESIEKRGKMLLNISKHIWKVEPLVDDN